MINTYKNGKIYQITDISYTLTYYGSTIEPLCKRMARHRSNYKTYKNAGKGDNITVYKIFDEFGIENCKIELVELCPCASKMELERKEGEYIKNNECVNKIIAGRTAKEWAKDHPDQVRVKSKKYYNTHKEIYQARFKEWAANNVEHLKERYREYYKDNRDKLRARGNEPFSCAICGGRYKGSHKSTHYRTLKHQNALNSSTHEPEVELNPEDDNTHDTSP